MKKKNPARFLQGDLVTDCHRLTGVKIVLRQTYHGTRAPFSSVTHKAHSSGPSVWK